jgi:hypothetical protein
VHDFRRRFATSTLVVDVEKSYQRGQPISVTRPGVRPVIFRSEIKLTWLGRLSRFSRKTSSKNMRRSAHPLRWHGPGWFEKRIADEDVEYHERQNKGGWRSDYK